MTALDIYLLIILDPITCISQILAIISGVLMLGAIAMFITNDLDEEAKEIGKVGIKLSTPIFILTFLIGVFLPNTKQMAAIIMIPKMYNAITENKQLNELPNNVVQLANDWINELKPKNQEK